MGQDILIMINSHPVNDNYLGGALWVHNTISVENIRRVEVIRGPGSALYGTNAFSGVINVITKDAEDIDGCQITASGGSYETQQYNILFGKIWNDITLSFNFNYFKTDGYEPYLEQDAQTGLDQIFGSKASLAPGYSKSEEEMYDVSLTLGYKGLKFDGRYVDRERYRLATPLYNVNKECFDKPYDYYLNLSYEGSIGENLKLMGKAYRNRNRFDASFYRAMPRESVILEPDPDSSTGYKLSEPLNEGLNAAFSETNEKTGTEIQTTYHLGDSNTLVGGITYEKIRQYDVSYSANVLFTPVANLMIPLPSVQDLTETQNVNKDADREFKAVFIQNLWDITDDLRLTLGFRYDDYSDFGESFNPRAGLTWQFVRPCDLKLLYGRAFRAPSFYELYNQNNPAVLGNPDLNPETVDTYEISFGVKLNAFSSRITGFRNSIDDSINLIPREQGGYEFQNADKLRSQGVEVEMKYDFGRGSYVGMNYAYQNAENLDTGEHLLNPRHVGNVMANIRLSEYFNVYTDFYFQKRLPRPEGNSPGFGDC